MYLSTNWGFPGSSAFNEHCPNTVRSESRCALRLRYVDFVDSIEVAVEVCAVVSLYSVVKQRLKCVIV
jgi:hypothetical protein